MKVNPQLACQTARDGCCRDLAIILGGVARLCFYRRARLQLGAAAACGNGCLQIGDGDTPVATRAAHLTQVDTLFFRQTQGMRCGIHLRLISFTAQRRRDRILRGGFCRCRG